MEMRQGSLDWFELQTSDLAGAKGFYGELFSWQFEENSVTGMPYTMLKVGDRAIGGIWQTESAMGIPPHWENYITVDDVDATAKKVEELGGQILMPPRDIPTVGRFCTFADPQGAVISAITYLPRNE